ncbi:oxidoreductase [Mariannaea sp. PMI_226]|nr:oxidoreductase [Mariannaea sp. PMI_226]
MTNAPSIKQRTVLVTGCSTGGAGNALALEFASRGFRVFATARSQRTLSNLRESGIETFTLDVTDPTSIASLKDEISKLTNGRLDMLFNNAGMMYEAPAIEADSRQVRGMFDTNVFGLFDMVSAFTPLLLKAVSGAQTAPVIINSASILGRLPYPFASAYNATKAAVGSYSDTLRLELSPLGIRVVTLFMGEVSTALMSPDNVSFGSDSIYFEVQDKVKERSVNHTKVALPAAEFARQVVGEVLQPKTSYVWKGSNSFIVWLLDIIGPRNVFDGTMKGPVGFSDSGIIKRLFDRGQQQTV